MPYLEGEKFEELLKNLGTEKVETSTGEHRADIIEAVGEGVIFNSLDHLLETHTTSLVALRPKTTEPERRTFLLRVFGLLGTEYDFFFDFSDASSHCCTEVVYRCLNRLGAIEFPLEKRGGYYNLSADTIVRTHYRTPEAFDLVFLAVQADDSTRARFLKGQEAEIELKRLVPE